MRQRADIAGNIDTARAALALPVIPSRLVVMWLEHAERRLAHL